MLDVVCLDLMGTIVYDPYLEALEAATGLDFATAAAVRDPDCWPQFESGAIDEAEFVRRFFTEPGAGHRFDLEAFHRVRRDGYRLLPGMGELLKALDGKVERYIASNYPVWIHELRTRFELDRLFDGIYVSCELGVRKPDAAFFEVMLDGIGAPAQRCLFVDDRRVNCDAAAAVGMAVHHFEGAPGLASRLRAEGVPV